MSQKLKGKKKIQQQSEVISEEYLTSHEVDLILKKGKDKLKHAIHTSDEKLTKTKKEIVQEMAKDLENAKYPIGQICDKLVKSLKGLVHEDTVRDALDIKYKNQSMAANAAHASTENPREHETAKIDVKAVTLQDIESLNKDTAKKVAKYQLSKSMWWEQQAKQFEEKLKENEESMKKMILEIVNNKDFSDAQVGKQMRQLAKGWSESK